MNENSASQTTFQSLPPAVASLAEGAAAPNVALTAPTGEASPRASETGAATVAEMVSHISPPLGAIVLETPIQRGDQLITAITLRKPDAGTLRGIKLAELLQMDVGALTTLLPRITSPTLTTADAGKLDPADLVAIASEVGNFFLTKAQRDSLPV